MPRSNGVYYLPGIYKATPGTTIRADQHNVPLEDIGQALTNSVARDGSADMTGNLKMGGNKITGLAAGSSAGDAVRFGQLGPAATKAKVDLVDDTEGTLPLSRGGTGATTASDARNALDLGELATGTKESHRVSNPTNNNDNPWLWAGSDVRAAVENWAPVFGVGQTWQQLTSNRSADTVYQNTTGKTIEVSIRSRAGAMEVSSTGSGDWVIVGIGVTDGRQNQTMSVPPSYYYRLRAGTLESWAEMR